MVLDLTHGRNHRKAADYIQECALAARDIIHELIYLQEHLQGCKDWPVDAPNQAELDCMIEWQTSALKWCIEQLESIGRRHGMRSISDAAEHRAWLSRQVAEHHLPTVF